MQVSTKDGMGGERYLEARVVGQKMQVLVENVVALVALEIVQEQMQIGGDVGSPFVMNINKIEANLEKNILMIKIQENVVPTLVLEEENTNMDVEPFYYECTLLQKNFIDVVFLKLAI
jgi:hypothetical protein